MSKLITSSSNNICKQKTSIVLRNIFSSSFKLLLKLVNGSDFHQHDQNYLVSASQHSKVWHGIFALRDKQVNLVALHMSIEY